jgi:hypothetical protein
MAEEAGGDAAVEVMVACTEAEEAVMEEEDSAEAGADLAEVEAAAAAAAAGTAAGIQEIKEAEEEREGNIPSFSFFINLFYSQQYYIPINA